MPGAKGYLDGLVKNSVGRYFQNLEKHNESYETSFENVDDINLTIEDINENIVELSLKDARDHFRKTLTKFQGDFEYNFDISAKNKNNHFEFNGIDTKLTVNPGKIESKRQVISDKMFEKIYANLKKNYINQEKGSKTFSDMGIHRSQVRNFNAFYITNHKFTRDEEDLKPEELFKFFKSDASTEQKQEKFHSYLKLLVGDLRKNCIHYKDDADFVEHYSELSEANWPFTVDKLEELTEAFGFSPSKESMDLYLDVRPYSQTLTNEIDSRAEIISDPSYARFDKENLPNFQQIFDSNQEALEQYNSIEISPFRNAYEGYTLEKRTQVSDTDKFYKRLYDLKETDTFITKDGKVSLKEALQAIEDKKRVELIRDGHEFIFDFTKEGLLKESKNIMPPYDVTDKKVYKDKFNECLKKLNANTAIFNPSSPEYKQLRTKFGELAKNDYSIEEMKNKLEEIKQISNVYKENHYKKPKVSDIACRRKESVDFVSGVADDMLSALEIDNYLVRGEVTRQQEEMNNNLDARSNVDLNKHQIIIDQVKDKNNLVNDNASIVQDELSTKSVKDIDIEKDGNRIILNDLRNDNKQQIIENEGNENENEKVIVDFENNILNEDDFLDNVK